MTSRSAHFHNKSKHAQREFGATAPKMAPRDTSTAWMGEFISSAQGTEEFPVDCLLTMQLGPDLAERALKLRALCVLGVLHMKAHRVDGKFIEYRWELTSSGRLA